MYSQVMLHQTVQGGGFVGREDRRVTITAPDDSFVGDYGDDRPRAVIQGVDGVPLRASDVHVLIANLTTALRAME